MPNTVTIPADRYEELIRTETRVQTIISYLRVEGYLSVDKLMALLGCHVPKRKEKTYEEVCEMDVEL